MKQTDVSQFLTDIEGGTLERQLGTVLSEAAAKAVDSNKAATIRLDLQIKPLGNGNHVVTVKHKLKAVIPNMRGKTTDETEGATSMHVGTGGSMSFFPEKQTELFSKKEPQQ